MVADAGGLSPYLQAACGAPRGIRRAMIVSRDSWLVGNGSCICVMVGIMSLLCPRARL